MISWSVQTLCILLLFSKVAVLLSTRISCLGIPSPFKRGLLKDFSLHFSTSRLEAKLPPSATAQFLLRAGLCCRVLQWRVDNTTSRACFQRINIYFIWNTNEEYYRAYCIFWNLANTFPFSYSAIPSLDCVIFSVQLQ